MGCGGSKSNKSLTNNVEQVNNQSPRSPNVGRGGNESPTDFDYTPTVVHHSPQRASPDNNEIKVEEKDIEIEGYVLKASPFANVGWHPRYFKLSDSNILEYYATKKDCELKKNLKGQINVKDIIGIEIINDHTLKFEVKNNEKSENQKTNTYELDCSSEENANEWKKAFESHF